MKLKIYRLKKKTKTKTKNKTKTKTQIAEYINTKKKGDYNVDDVTPTLYNVNATIIIYNAIK